MYCTYWFHIFRSIASNFSDLDFYLNTENMLLNPSQFHISSCLIYNQLMSPIPSLSLWSTRTIYSSDIRIVQGTSMKNVGGQVCQICGDNVGTTAKGDPFGACDVCAFPVCRPCYEYERKDGNQSCPQCKTRYKRHKGFDLRFSWFLNINLSYLQSLSCYISISL